MITGMLLIISFLNFKRYVFSQKSVALYGVFFCFLISLFIGLLSNVGFEDIFRALCIIVLIFSFPFNINWNSNLFYYILFSTGIYLVVFQLGGALGVGPIHSFIETNYPISDNLWSEEASYLTNINEYLEDGSFKRFGGIFYNPNIMGQIMVFWYAIMRNFSTQIQRFVPVVILVALTSILFSGSRTAFLVFAIYNVFLYWSKVLETSFVFVQILMGVLILALFNVSFIDKFRIFDISQGVTSREGSGSMKLETFKKWIDHRTSPDNFNLPDFLFGHLNWNDILFDNDVGYFLSFFGFAGAFLFLFFLCDIYKYSTKLGKLNFVILLIGIGATIIMNFRFSILLFLILSIGYKRQVCLK
jgi:hypothetical protein